MTDIANGLRIETLENQRHALLNSFGLSAFSDGKTRDRIAEIDAELGRLRGGGREALAKALYRMQRPWIMNLDDLFAKYHAANPGKSIGLGEVSRIAEAFACADLALAFCRTHPDSIKVCP